MRRLCLAIILIYGLSLVKRWRKLEKERKELAQITSFVNMIRKKSENQTHSEEIKMRILPELRKLYRLNPDIAGWISVEGTGIDYPFMWTPQEPEYYLHRDFYGKDSYGGTPFMEKFFFSLGVSDYIIILYGHNMRNGTMFADLLKYKDYIHWESYGVIHAGTLTERQRYKVFSAFYAKEEDWTMREGIFYQIQHHEFTSKKELAIMLKQKSLYGTGYTPDPEAIFICLVTCGYRKAGDRFVIVGEKL